MTDSSHFSTIAQQHGFSGAAASAALAAIEGRLAGQGVATRRLLFFRSGAASATGAAGPSGAAPQRPRLLLAFRSADAALAFAQRSGIGSAPRLVTLSLAQALAVLLQRPEIGALLIADDEGPRGPDGLPPGIRVGRDGLIELLAGVTP